ncbi:RNA 2'-phosphotransferase [Agromyces albus]|uniref:RNA 2'-phosphotransferase n=1 Tax=Agromyces albus TaxID=205332 RepID=UPI0027D8473F|nr:RNA 2'-phosphotransferase [Agromyces albus]
MDSLLGVGVSDVEADFAIEARLGIATVSAARFSIVDAAKLNRACDALRRAHAREHESASTYLVEGYTQIYDYTGDLEALRIGARFTQDQVERAAERDVGWNLACSEIWMKLAGVASPGARDGFLTQAQSYLHRAEIHADESTIVDQARMLMLGAFLYSVVENNSLDQTGLQGVRFPFGLRSRTVIMPQAFVDAGDEILDRLESHADAGHFFFRDIAAELCAYLARHVSQSDDRVYYLKRAIKFRAGEAYQAALPRDTSALDQAQDQLLLAVATADSRLRREGLRGLCELVGRNKLDPTAITVLAVEIESNGALLGPLLNCDEAIAIAVRSGDARVLFEMAARRALLSHDTQRESLGGRGGCVIARDYAGLTGETFVFKETSHVAHERDSKSSDQVRSIVSEAGLGDRFGVIEHLASLDMALEPTGPESEAKCVSVRRFMSGRTLATTLRISEAGSRVAVVGDTAEFLGLIHARLRSDDVPAGVRRDLWEREFGRWLRYLFPSDGSRRNVFEQWWSCVQDAPMLPRRDAHALNWIVDDKSRILAVDLESIGWRPLGYELAQLLEDEPVFDADDAAAYQVWDRYVAALYNYAPQSVPENHDLKSLLDAGRLARAVRTFSAERASAPDKKRAGEMVGLIAERWRGTALGRASASVSVEWSKKIGAVPSSAFERRSLGTRRRISRAMSFHLRHNALAEVDREGWMHVDALRAALVAEGHRVSADDVVLIAGALGEPRFELNGSEIRARYGHSRRTRMGYATGLPSRELYHATPMSNLASIVEAKDGLRPGGRQFVHLTEDIRVATSAAGRKKQQVAVFGVDATQLQNIQQAAVSTWLATRVPLSALRLVPLYEVQRIQSSMPSTSHADTSPATLHVLDP